MRAPRESFEFGGNLWYSAAASMAASLKAKVLLRGPQLEERESASLYPLCV